MKKALTLVSIACLVAVVAFGACSRGNRKMITLAGSTAFQPMAEKLAELYMPTHPDVRINVQGGGSAVGIQAALAGNADIGMADLIELPREAKELTATVVARDGIALIVNPQNPITKLSSAEARDIFAGRIVSWKSVGGADVPIRVISREDGSGTRRTFDKLVLGLDKLAPSALYQNSNGTVREAVAQDANAIGYISMGLVNNQVKGISYNGVAANNDNVKRGVYPLARPVYFLTKAAPSAWAQEFIAYVLSPEGQQILVKEGLIDAK
jgi:phosphate transport system substrate-binding protein